MSGSRDWRGRGGAAEGGGNLYPRSSRRSARPVAGLRGTARRGPGGDPNRRESLEAVIGVRLSKAHLLPGSPLRAVQIINGWLDQLGPTLHFEDQTAVLSQIRATTRRFAFGELPSDAQLLERWQTVHDRWCSSYAGQAAALPQRLPVIRQEGAAPKQRRAPRKARRAAIEPTDASAGNGGDAGAVTAPVSGTGFPLLRSLL